MMTDLETAIFLAWRAITHRYPDALSFDEKQEYYRELFRRLQQILPEEKANEQDAE